jgi:hypothetical protein
MCLCLHVCMYMCAYVMDSDRQMRAVSADVSIFLCMYVHVYIRM